MMGVDGSPRATSLSLICPAYQDQENVGGVVSSALTVLPRHFEKFEIIIVDDGSSDGTAEEVLTAARGDHRVRLIRHPKNMGYGQALRTGLSSVDGSEWVCFTDGDGQYDVAEIAGMIPLMDEYDAVTGARRRNRNVFRRRFMSRGFNTLIRLFFRVPYRDLTSSLKLFRREVCPEIELLSRGNFTDVELILRAHYNGFRINEIPIEHHPREFGRSHSMSFRRILETFVEMGRVYLSLQPGHK
jgi:glycosyltransferase involved in cell wall biosynthesis